MSKNLKIIFLGAPGSGKGTVAEKLIKDYDIAHLSTGAIFSEALPNNGLLSAQITSYLEKGELVPDEITNELVKNKINNIQELFIISFSFIIDIIFLLTLWSFKITLYPSSVFTNSPTNISFALLITFVMIPFVKLFLSRRPAVLGRQHLKPTPWLTERHGYDPTLQYPKII